MKELTISTNRVGYNVHDSLKHLDVPELKKIADNDRLNFAVMFMNVTGDLNLGVTLRAAHLLGAKKFITFGKKRIDGRSTVGSQNYTNLYHVEAPVQFDSHGNPLNDKEFVQYQNNSLAIFNDYMGIMNYVPIFVDHCDNYLGSPNAWSFIKPILNANKTPCLVFGNEGLGIPTHIINGYRGEKHSIAIPQRGVIRSFNVASAASIVMWDLISKEYSNV